MALVKIYSNEQLDDVGMNRCWKVSLRYKFEEAQRKELEDAVKRISNDTMNRLGAGNLGYQVNKKTVCVWFADGDSDGEFLSRNITDDLLKLVNRKWGNPINPERFGEHLLC